MYFTYPLHSRKLDNRLDGNSEVHARACEEKNVIRFLKGVC